MSQIKVLLIALALALPLAGCALGGTEAGNPNIRPETSTKVYVTEQVMGAACDKLHACNPGLAVATCQSGLKAQSNLPAAIGLVSGYATYQNAINAEIAGTIVPNSNAALVCLSDIGALACGSAPVTSAWSAASPSDFSNVINLIPTSGTSCAGIF